MKYIIRIDDFPWNKEKKKDVEEFSRLYSIFEDHRIPIVLGVIPSVCDTKDILNIRLREYVYPALHGYSHQGFDTCYGEFTYLTEEEKMAKIDSGLSILRTDAFIPPFNSFDNVDVKILDYMGFKYLFGKDNYGIRKMGSLIYLPSEDLLYDKAYKVIDNLSQVKEDEEIKVITLHCTWEYPNLDYVRKLCSILKDQVISITEVKCIKEIKLDIVSAIYSTDEKRVDITRKLKDMNLYNRIFVKVSNWLVGYDIDKGEGKSLEVGYTIDGKPKSIKVEEQQILELP